MSWPRETALPWRPPEAAHDAVLVTNRNSLRIVDANAAACEMCAFTRDELIGMDSRYLTADPEAGSGGVHEGRDESRCAITARRGQPWFLSEKSR